MSGDEVPLLERLDDIEERGLAALREASDEEELEEARVRFLGRGGEVSGALGRIGQIPEEDRPAAGRRGNEVKRRLESVHEERAEELEREARRAEAEALDLTLPGRRAWTGGSHPVTLVVDGEEKRRLVDRLGDRAAAGDQLFEEDFRDGSMSLEIVVESVRRAHPALAISIRDLDDLDQGVTACRQS